MTTLVTGATGLLGNNVVRALLERNEHVRVLARDSSDSRPLAGLDVEIVRGDVREPDKVQAAVQGVDTVVHSAAWVQIGWTGAETARAINVEGTRNVAEAARDAGARMIHTSTVNTLSIGTRRIPADEDSPGNGQILCPYVATKRESEQLVMDLVREGLNAVIVNPGFMLGPWDWKPSSGAALLRIARHYTPYAPRGGCSVCDVRDVAAGILGAIAHGKTGQRYILAGENMTYHNLTKLCARTVGRRGPLHRSGPLFVAITAVMGACCDLHTRLTGREGTINSASIRMTAQYHYYSSARAESELHYSIRPAQEAVQAAWDWFQQHEYV